MRGRSIVSHIKRTWQVENGWACPACSALNRGHDMACQTCGARKDAEVIDILSGPQAPEVTDPAQVREATAGANWQCEHCGNQERNLRGECAHCGGPKARAPLQAPVEVSQQRSRQRRLPLTWYLRVLWRPLLGTGALGGLVWLIIWLCTPRTVDARVSDLSWTYTITLRERIQLHNDGQWNRPGDRGFYHEPAFNLTCDSRYYGTEDCHPHDCRPHPASYDCNYTTYECNCMQSCTDNKNGYSTCTERCSTCSRHDTCSRTEYDTCYDACPVYKDWCSYDYYDWPVKATRQTAGHDHAVHWPDLHAEGPLQRVQKVEAYGVKFRAEDETYDYAPETLLEYKSFDLGAAWQLKVGKVRGKIDSLERAQAEQESR